jgi:hypothetical protein
MVCNICANYACQNNGFSCENYAYKNYASIWCQVYVDCIQYGSKLYFGTVSFYSKLYFGTVSK